MNVKKNIFIFLLLLATKESFSMKASLAASTPPVAIEQQHSQSSGTIDFDGREVDYNLAELECLVRNGLRPDSPYLEQLSREIAYQIWRERQARLKRQQEEQEWRNGARRTMSNNEK